MSDRILSAGLAVLMLSAGAVGAQEAATDSLTAQVTAADGTDHGTVTVQPTASGYSTVTLDLQGLPPGQVAVHLHETGACEGPTFESAGGHLALEGQEHGVMVESGPHVGDLPNLHVPESGEAMVEHFAPELTAEVMNDDDGTAFVIHGGTDDYESQPSGDAGDRIACGVLAAAQ
ncbi:superoxide dismutase family protein [Paracoccus beibuensis]|uniref:superoxide dismutase family protein n=1 Tax=Paracoccus beibuensis TaxID=547602 RepID=UPI00223EB1B4|nr:superoxide dismutase family protein [Paracoccus beibuensis]